MDELSIAFILLCIAIIILLAMSIYKEKRHRKKRKKKGLLAFVGILLVGFGLYELPWGAMELYKITELVFGFDLLHNYIFWTVICLISISLVISCIRRGDGYAAEA